MSSICHGFVRGQIDEEPEEEFELGYVIFIRCKVNSPGDQPSAHSRQVTH
jgi:hypothetical protein